MSKEVEMEHDMFASDTKKRNPLVLVGARVLSLGRTPLLATNSVVDSWSKILNTCKALTHEDSAPTRQLFHRKEPEPCSQT